MTSAYESSEARLKEKGLQIQEYVKEHNLASLLRPGAASAAAAAAASSTSGEEPSTAKASSSSTPSSAGSILV